MKCGCDQGLDSKVKKVCEHHQRYFDAEYALVQARLRKLEAENEILSGLVEIKHILEGVKAISSPLKVVKKKR